MEELRVKSTEMHGFSTEPGGHGNEHGPLDDFLLGKLEIVIRLCVRILAVLMTVAIIFGVIDVVYLMHSFAMSPPYFVLKISDILELFGAFLAVLIAIEIFVNITVYLRSDVIHVNIVLATALMAIARKVIILDYDDTDAAYVYATAAVVVAMAVAYWLVAMRGTCTIQIPGSGAKAIAAPDTNGPSESAGESETPTSPRTPRRSTQPRQR